MSLFLNILLLVVMAAVLVILGTGLVSFVIGGEFNRKYGNKLMRLRVAAQAVAVLLLLSMLLLRHMPQ